MRKLIASQKQILNRYEVLTADDLPDDAWERVESLNNYETLWQDVNRYLGDNAVERQQKGGMF